MTANLRLGGFTGTAPAVFFIRKDRIPEGLKFEPKKTKFSANGVEYRIDTVDNEPHEPHVKLTTDLATR